MIASLAERRRTVVRTLIGEWPQRKLRRHARIGNGSTPRRDNADYWTDGSIPWVNSSVVNLPVVTRPSELVTTVALAECHLPVVATGSLLVGLTGQGKTRGAATRTAMPTTINQHLAFVTMVDATWSPPFLLYSFQAAYDHLRYISSCNGSTKGALTCSDLGEQWFPAPPLEDQELITRRIDEQTAKIDDLTAECRELIALLKERRAALITAAVTGKIDVRTG